ncbi:YitT family protein [Allobaculum sp. JKK-2023]|uniref:YitT family protein n=1 Tax=Allobaculum sp. JKK-2023 TaxID=3108943 RepID=UPI002B0600FE|nr:YitT family protein [Allobaculum sp. JKK-2023]
MQTFLRKFSWKTLFSILLGNFLVAIGTVFFILPEDILNGGVTTVAILLRGLFGWNEVLVIYIANIGLFFLGWACLGKKFAATIALSTFIYPFLVSLLSPLDTAPFANIDPILSALYSGIITGAGLGLVFRVNASTGGMDIPALLMHKYLHIPTGQCVMIVDSITILSGLPVFGLNSVLIGLISVMSMTFMINQLQTLGSESAMSVMIISEKWPEIQDYLLEDISRGVTILQGEGAWSKQSRPVLMCVINTRQYAKVQREVGLIDPKAFLIANNVHEVRGAGFTYKDGDL